MVTAAVLDLPPGYLGIALRTPTLPPATHTNCFVLGHERALVVDPGPHHAGELGRLERLLFEVRGTGGGIAAVLLTHHHRDHVGGAAAIARRFGVPVAAHRETLCRLRLPPAVPQVAVKEGQCFAVDPGRAVQVLCTPGHAPGHLCLHEPAARALLVGDMVPGAGTAIIAPPEGDMAAYLASLRRLASLDPRWLLPAHGPPRCRQARELIEQQISHRLTREQRVLSSLASAPRDLWSVTRAAYSDVSPLLWPLGSRSALAHLIDLERQGRVRRLSGERWTSTTARG